MDQSKTPVNLIYSSELCIKLMEQPRLITTKQNICLKMTRPNMMVAYINLTWIKYLTGKVEVRLEVPDMELKKLQFRVVDVCTMAYNYDRHFCDRIPQVLSMLKHFEGYLALNKGRLENRSLETRDDKGGGGE